jgi:hypothetical protein
MNADHQREHAPFAVPQACVVCLDAGLKNLVTLSKIRRRDLQG